MHEDIRSKTGLSVDEITLEAVMSGKITAEDIKISKDALLRQSQVAQDAGRRQMSENFNRAAELTDVPDDVILSMYNLLRPNRATKQELLTLADTLENQYKATACAQLAREAAAIYEKRGILL